MTDFKPGDKVRVNGDDREWTVTSPGNRQGCWISLLDDKETHHAAYAWLTLVTPSLHPAYADAQPGDVVRADGKVWECGGRYWYSDHVDPRTTVKLAALDPNPVRLVPLTDLRAEVEGLRAQVEKVRELHKDDLPHFKSCAMDHPCDTLRALDSE